MEHESLITKHSMVKICILTIDNNLFIIYSGKKYILEDIKSHENI